MNLPQNQIIVKSEWQELTEDDRTDINKFDKYLSDLLSQDKVTNSQYELIIEYILGRAYLAKFITGRLKSHSSSKAKNKYRLMHLINRLILEKESDKKRCIVQQLEEALCQIFVNIFEEYKNDASKIENFKLMRLGWVKKVSDETIYKMGEEIGNNHFIDIDQGLSEESVEKIKLYYFKNNIDPNIYLKKAIDEIEQKKSQQINSSVQTQKNSQEKLLQEKKKKKPVLPQQAQSSQQPQQKQERPIQQQQVSQLSQEEKKKLQQQKMRKNSSNQNSEINSNPQQQSQQQQQQQQHQQIKSQQNDILQNNQTSLNSLLTTQNVSSLNSSSQQINKKDDNDVDIQIKKKPKKPIQPISGHIHQSPSVQQKPANSSIPHHKPSVDTINGNTPQKKVKTVPQVSGNSNQKNDSNTYNPASIRPQNQQAQHLQNQQQINQQVKPNRLPENIQKERVKKLNEESKNLKTPQGLLLMPTQSLGYGLASQPEPQPIQTSSQQQIQFNSSQGHIQIGSNQEGIQPYIPQTPNLLNTSLPPPLPPQPQQNMPQSIPSSNQQFLPKSQQQIEIKQQQTLTPLQSILQPNHPSHSLQSSQNQFGSNQDFNSNTSLQKQINKPPLQMQNILPTSTHNFSNNMQQSSNQDPLQNQTTVSQNINVSSNAQRNQDFNIQNQQSQSNQPMFMNQRLAGSGPQDNQGMNLNIRKKYPPGPSLPYQQPPPPPPTPLGQLIDNQNNFQMNMDIESQNNNNIPRRQIPPFNQIIQPQHQPPPPLPHMQQQNIQNMNGNRTPQGSSQNLNSSGQIEQNSQTPHIIPPYQQPPPPPTQIAPIRQISQSGYNLAGIQQDKTSLFYELFNFIKPTMSTKYYFISEIEKMKQNKITSIHPQLFLNRNEEIIMNSRSIIYDSLPYQCANCGIRFSAKEDLKSHLEDHTIKNLKIIESKREKEKEKKNRQLFYDANQWIDCQDEDIEKEQESESETEKNYFVPQSKSNGKCDLCQEPFILTWSEDNEDWVYENAKRFEIFETSTGKCQIAIVHLTCYKVLEKQSEIENQGNEEQFESTEKLLS
ncbi:zinc finger, C2H2 type family protein (macronuclear) [Tetrahymena thermophila SB210]|uniref:Zinc finger, C2H2 type family protein n=1 Tax=Tetrahymena thermophila (strain SB210) TaxID=312017 RepID=I7M8I0_TETTS|nr:zinc finger, C2H2 type family protein [Tetrahymena thermophila SB210]EAR98214.2 zinc finger, C2H2 type family protein [Tetrahymena thermophila SB210]|eukprot:XP_001018459.2 zinc finger, C2H2 type family protein [Tetrahymena thermophila SB210]